MAGWPCRKPHVLNGRFTIKWAQAPLSLVQTQRSRETQRLSCTASAHLALHHCTAKVDLRSPLLCFLGSTHQPTPAQSWPASLLPPSPVHPRCSEQTPRVQLQAAKKGKKYGSFPKVGPAARRTTPHCRRRCCTFRAFFL